MTRKTSLYLGSMFLLTSGLLFTIDRLTRYIYRSAEIYAGDYPTKPEAFFIFDNLFIPLFIVIGISFFVFSHLKKNQESD